MLAERYKVTAEVWSVTSYQQLRREGLIIERWNRLHPTQKPRKSYFEKQLAAEPFPIVAASDYVKLVADQVRPWAPAEFTALGTDGFGRSEARKELRQFFEVDAESIVLAALHTLMRRGQVDARVVEKALCDFGINPEHPDPARS
jgi:pyruvate dehydrogenase E1 component